MLLAVGWPRLSPGSIRGHALYVRSMPQLTYTRGRVQIFRLSTGLPLPQIATLCFGSWGRGAIVIKGRVCVIPVQCTKSNSHVIADTARTRPVIVPVKTSVNFMTESFVPLAPPFQGNIRTFKVYFCGIYLINVCNRNHLTFFKLSNRSAAHSRAIAITTKNAYGLPIGILYHKFILVNIQTSVLTN